MEITFEQLVALMGAKGSQREGYCVCRIGDSFDKTVAALMTIEGVSFMHTEEPYIAFYETEIIELEPTHLEKIRH